MLSHPKLNLSKFKHSFPLSVEVLESRDAPAAAAGNDLIWKTYAPTDAFLLHSNPGANQVIFMDFDGNVTAGTAWNAANNSGNPFTSLAWDDGVDNNRNNFSTAERNHIIDLWRRVSEDFIPFNVDVTTQDPGLEGLRKTSAADTKWGIRVVIGPPPSGLSNPGAFATAGGIAYIGSFDWNTDTPCFVFNGDSSSVPEFSLNTTVSHEVGHTFGLAHDGTAALAYYPGHGAGVTSWGPIMGAAFGRNLDQWSRDTYPSANNPEDDLAIISTGHGFGYRTDDYGNTIASAKLINGPLQTALTTTYGIIEKNTDVDFFKFYADPGPINIQIDPLFAGPNLDILATLYSPSGAVLATSNPLALLNANFIMNVTDKGAYSIKIEGTGLAGATGYAKYGSLGNYRITGTVKAFTPPSSSFKNLNPIRWSYNAATRTYDGSITIANITAFQFKATFTFTLTLPESVRVVGGTSGTQVGNQFKITYTGTIAPNKPLALVLKLSNPLGKPLATGANTFVTDIQIN